MSTNEAKPQPARPTPSQLEDDHRAGLHGGGNGSSACPLCSCDDPTRCLWPDDMLVSGWVAY